MKSTVTIFIGLLVSFFVMTFFEFINSLFFPFPSGMNTMNLEEVRRFTRSLPPAAFIMVLLGWAFGALAAGYITTKRALRKHLNVRVVVSILATIMTVFAVLNNFIFLPGVQPLWFNVVGLPLFFVFTYIGYRLADK
jgi:hypothetical protein